MSHTSDNYVASELYCTYLFTSAITAQGMLGKLGLEMRCQQAVAIEKIHDSLAHVVQNFHVHDLPRMQKVLGSSPS